jgi:5-methylcytosine-specific restriction enzyme A
MFERAGKSNYRPMKNAIQIVFRCLTKADFYNINKPRGSEARGGGQSYIDFPTSAIKAADWKKFFDGEKTITTPSGPLWRFTIHSLGLAKSQELEVGQRRSASFNIRAQKLGTRASNRVFAWHPQHSEFPAPKDPSKRVAIPNLVIYVAKTDAGEYWAGWFQAAKPSPDWNVDSRLNQLFAREQGTIYLDPPIPFDENEKAWPFRALTGANIKAAVADVIRRELETISHGALLGQASGKPPARRKATSKSHFQNKSEADFLAELFVDDLSSRVPATKEITIRILQRNSRIVAALKALYGGKCQISGEEYGFRKVDGEPFSEAHHLIPLGEGGADSPYNMIILNPLLHRMLHYAQVNGLDLSKIKDNRLTFQINDKEYTITWHPRHAELVNSFSKAAE